jgi:chemotaxis protein methyltransferase CheR
MQIQGICSAHKFCTEAISIDNLNYEYHYLLGTIYKEMGNIDESLNALRRAIFLHKDFIMAYYMIGIISSSKGNYMEARKNFLTALELLSNLKQDEAVPYSEGIPAAKLAEIISSIIA